MKVILVSPRGFCAGVKMAIGSLERALELFGSPIYVYHEIVHNCRVVETFKKRGVVFVDSIEDVPQGRLLVYSAHGVPPDVHHRAQNSHLHTIDATCPLVKKVHHEAMQYTQKGYAVILIGHPGHDEVIAALGTAPRRIELVSCVEDVDRLKLDDECACIAYLTQTTLSLDDTTQIVERLRQRFPSLTAPKHSDICYATQNRQKAVKQFLPFVDLVLVLGSKNSSNSAHLTEIALAHSVPAHLIDEAREIDQSWLHSVKTMLMTAGASAPEEAVNECVTYLIRHFQAEVEEKIACDESITFPLPVELCPNSQFTYRNTQSSSLFCQTIKA